MAFPSEDGFLASHASHTLSPPLAGSVACRPLLKKVIWTRPYLEAETMGSELGRIYTGEVNSTKPISTAHAGLCQQFPTCLHQPECKAKILPACRQLLEQDVGLAAQVFLRGKRRVLRQKAGTLPSHIPKTGSIVQDFRTSSCLNAKLDIFTVKTR